MRQTVPETPRNVLLARGVMERLVLAEPSEPIEIEELSGGVSSNILKVKVASATYCLNQSLPRLKAPTLSNCLDRRSSHRRFALMSAVGSRVQIVGDDYLVTDAARVRSAAEKHVRNVALIKPNQAGTVTDMRVALLSAQEAGFATIISARSGDSEDIIVVHLAVGWNSGQLKVGSFARSERMARWNEGIRIEIGWISPFAGASALVMWSNYAGQRLK